jgi:hypothetical protein
VHKDTVVACVRCVSPPVHHEIRSFATTTSGLLALAEWLSAHACTWRWKRPASTGSPDVNDAMRIADLLAHGLIR